MSDKGKLEKLVHENAQMVGYAVVALSVVVVILLLVLMLRPSEKFTANTVRMQDSDQDFYRERYINLEGQQDRAGSAFADANGDLPQVGRIELANCQVSEMANADPWLWMYQGLKGNASTSAAPGALLNTKEGMSDAELGAAMAGGNAKTGRVMN